MTRLIPVAIAIVAVVALTVVEGQLTQRWGDNRHGAYCATLLDEVPSRIGDWVGVDSDVDEEIQVTAGARSFVSRTYRNESTGEAVAVWLIVGHARDTARHTPDICYRTSGFEFDPKQRHTLDLPGGEQATFFTTVFTKTATLGELKERVYWTWFKPTLGSGGGVQWDAPKNVRMEIGAAPALYKLYFSTNGPAADAGHDETVCLRFAKEFFPAVEPILSPANGDIPEDFDPSVAPEV